MREILGKGKFFFHGHTAAADFLSDAGTDKIFTEVFQFGIWVYMGKTSESVIFLPLPCNQWKPCQGQI